MAKAVKKNKKKTVVKAKSKAKVKAKVAVKAKPKLKIKAKGKIKAIGKVKAKTQSCAGENQHGWLSRTQSGGNFLHSFICHCGGRLRRE